MRWPRLGAGATTRTRAERLREAGIDPDSPGLRRVLALAEQLIGFPRHLSQHPGGMVMTGSRCDDLVPIENAAMPERTVIQWDKDDLDELGSSRSIAWPWAC